MIHNRLRSTYWKLALGALALAVALAGCAQDERPAPGEPEPVSQMESQSDLPEIAESLRSIGQSGAVLAEPGSTTTLGAPRQLWRYQGDGPVVVAPVVADGVVVVGFADYSFRALDAATGEEIWVYALDTMPIAARFGRSGLYVADEATLALLSIENGAPVWSVDVAPAPGSGLLVTSAAVYLIRKDGRIAAFDAETGNAVWTTTAPGGEYGSGVGRPSALDGIVYTVTTGGVLRAHSAADGAALFSVSLPAAPAAGPMVREWGVVVLGTDGTIVVVDRESGKELRKELLDGPWLVSAVPRGEGMVLADAAGTIHQAESYDGAVTEVAELVGDTAGQPGILDMHLVAADVSGFIHLIPVAGRGAASRLETGLRVVGPFAYDGNLYAGGANGEVIGVALDAETSAVPLLDSSRWWALPLDGRFRMADRSVTFVVNPDQSQVVEWIVRTPEADDHVILTVTNAEGDVIATNMGKVALESSVRAPLRAGRRYQFRIERSLVDDQTVITARSRVIE